MSTATADEPKEDPKKPETRKEKLAKEYPEKIKVRVWDKKGKQFLDERTVQMKRMEKDGETVFIMGPGQGAGNTIPVPGSELTDEKGVVWVSTTCNNLMSKGTYRVEVKKKP